jgi:hypothetical protein
MPHFARPLVNTALFIAVASATALPARALANGDPASDTLLTQQTFAAFGKLSPAIARDLDRVQTAAREAGYPVRVAIIAGREDLGQETDFFGKPQEYATFLAGELEAFGRLSTPSGHPPAQTATGPLVVVMPGGFGTDGLSPGARSRIREHEPAPEARPDDLARAAGLAVEELADAAGHSIPEVFGDPGGGSGGLIAIVLAALLVIAASLAIAVRVRERDEV